MVKKRKGRGDDDEENIPYAKRRVRNRASPSAVVKLYDHLSPGQKIAVCVFCIYICKYTSIFF